MACCWERHQFEFRTVSQHITGRIDNYRKTKKLLRAWEAQTLHLIELKAPK
jgi:hypothetical protein